MSQSFCDIVSMSGLVRDTTLSCRNFIGNVEMHHAARVQQSAGEIEIDLRLAGLLTGKTSKTMQRWCLEGVLPSRVVDQRGKRLVAVSAVLPHTPLNEEDGALVALAAAGDAEAFDELGVLYLEAGLPELAYEWFSLAAKAGHADAMHWLSKIHIYGGMGKEKNEALGWSWLAAAAAKGHQIAKAQCAMLGMCGDRSDKA
ncbi:MAG: hypothetical protein ACRYGK_10060 [Janthinobacterium lividum]